jgi:hypothetical protein
VRESEVEDRPATQRKADERGALDADGIEHSAEVVVEGEGKRRFLRTAEAACVVPDDAVRTREDRELPIPQNEPALARMEEDDRRTRTSLFVVEGRAVGWREARLDVDQ